MGRSRIYQPYNINFGRERSGGDPWLLTLTLHRTTGRGRELVRHRFSPRDLERLHLALEALAASNREEE